MIKSFTAGKLTGEITELIVRRAMGETLWYMLKDGIIDEEMIQQSVGYLIEKGHKINERNILRLIDCFPIDEELQAVEA